MKRGRKIIALLLAAVLCLGTLSMTAFATEVEKVDAGEYVFNEHVAAFNFDAVWNLTLGEDGSYKLTTKNDIMGDTIIEGTYSADGSNVVLTPSSCEGPTLASFLNGGTAPMTVVVYEGNEFIPEGYDPEATADLPDDIGEETDPQAVEADTWTGQIYDSVAYVEDGSADQTMDVYVPEGEGTHPLLIVIHGGAFKMGDSKMAIIQPMYEYFRDNGYVCASLNYSLGAGTYPQAIIDCKTAIQYLVDNAAEYNIDPSNITVMGESAGAYLAIMTSITGASDFVAEGAADYTFDVTNLIDFYGPVYSGNDGGLASFVGDAQGHNPEEYLESGNTDLNIWIQCGTADAMVPYDTNSQLFNEALKTAGFNVSYEEVEGAGHMDAVFYTDENLAAINEWLSGNAVVAEPETDDAADSAVPETVPDADGGANPVVVVVVIVIVVVVIAAVCGIVKKNQKKNK